MPRDVFEDFFLEASEAMTALADQVGRLARKFRRYEIADAQQGLARLPGELSQFVVLVDVLSDPGALEPVGLSVGGIRLEDQAVRLAGWLERIIEAQRNEDWIAIADILEKDLEPLLRALGPRLLEYAPVPPAAA